MVSFLSWEGYNFEDSIVVSERVVKEDLLTSLNIIELEVTAKDTEFGAEEITKDVPGVSEEQLKYLDEDGIVTIGSYVKPGTILVGRIIPKVEDTISPEEKLLRSIFGEKAQNVKDISLKTPYDVEGKVIDIKVLHNPQNGETDVKSSYFHEKQKLLLEGNLAIIKSIKNKIKFYINELKIKFDYTYIDQCNTIKDFYNLKSLLDCNDIFKQIIQFGEKSLEQNNIQFSSQSSNVRHGSFLTRIIVSGRLNFIQIFG